MAIDHFSTLDSIIARNSAEQIEFLQALVRAKSANPYTVDKSTPDSGIEKEMAAVIAAQLRAIGLEPTLIGASPERPNVVATLQGTANSGKTLALNGHMDTVMPSKQWTMDPFGATIVGNRLYGLGVLDMKASLAVFIYAAKALLEAGITLGGDLLLTFAVDEEPGGASPYGTNYLLDHGLTATTAIVAEPGLDNVTIGHRGGYRFKITVRGEAAHTGSLQWERRELGKNAIAAMGDVITALRDLEIPSQPAAAFPGRKSVFTFPTLIQGGATINTVPEECIAYGDSRLMPGNTEAQLEGLIRERLDRIEGLDYSLDKLLFVPAVQIATDEPIVQILKGRTQEIAGITPTTEGCGPWNDGWMFISRGIPAICGFGPAGAGVHAADEYVELDSFIATTRIFVRAIIDYLGVAE